MKNIFASLFFILAFSCNPKKKTPDIGFYFWRSEFNISTSQQQYLDTLNAKRLYVKAFDVDTSLNSGGEIVVIPASILTGFPSQKIKQEIVPVIYLTRASILLSKNLDSLANNLHHLLNQIIAKQQWICHEIQWDFDWTPSTKNSYFKLLTILKAYPDWKQKQFSATIRLHQIKNRNQTGIPPVDKGVLMCYNIGKLKNYDSKNTILDLEIMKEYLTNMNHYPLSLDIALPIFNWTLQLRDKKFLRILNAVTEKEIVKSKNFKKSPIGFVATNDGNFQGLHYKVGDELKPEFIEPQLLQRSLKFLSNNYSKQSANLIFFDLNLKTIHQYPSYEIQKIIQNY